jgi:hypothetical protein
MRVAWQSMMVRLVTAFIMHYGKMSASLAAEAVRSKSRHRANVGRYLGRRSSVDPRTVNRLGRRMILSELRRRGGEWFFVLDQTYCGHQGQRTENTFSRANYRLRSKKSNRRQKKTGRRSCHGFVMGLLISPRGCRIPCFRSYLTENYCRQHGLPYRTQTDLAADLIRELPLPRKVRLTVLGDTAFDAKTIRVACRERGCGWIVPLNPERVLAGARPRPKVSSLIARLKASALVPVRLVPGQGPLADQHRAARCRCESRTACRTFYVHGERRTVNKVGDVLLVFSTKERPTPNQKVKIQKVLMTNETSWSARRIVQCYDLRWQIELMFKELKSTLGLDHYQFRRFLKVEHYVAACLVTFLYLEWFRLRALARPKLSAAERKRYTAQRTYGLCRMVRQHAEINDLQRVAQACRTKTGLRRLRHELRQAIPTEYRTNA